MARTLHILTREDELTAHVRKEAREDALLIDLTAGEPDYRKLLEAIFEAESVHVW